MTTWTSFSRSPLTGRTINFRILALAALCTLLFGSAFGGTQVTNDTSASSLDLPAKGSVWVRNLDDPAASPIQLFRTPITVNRHLARNFAGSAAASVFYRPLLSVELKGAHSETQLIMAHPAIYVRASGAFEDQADLRPGTDASRTLSDLVLVHLNSRQDKRVESSITYNGFGGGAKRNMKTVMVRRETLESGWETLTPSEVLEPGEYALVAIPRSAANFSETAYDFGIEALTAKPALQP